MFLHSTVHIQIRLHCRPLRWFWHICRESVLGAGVVITGSTHIIDVTEAEPKQYKGYVPAGSVVIPGSYPKRFPAGEYGVPCALIIGRRKESTDKKTSLTAALRDFGVSV